MYQTLIIDVWQADKHGPAPERFEPLRGQQSWQRQLQPHTGLTEGYLPSEAALALCWLVLACRLVSGVLNQKQTFGTWKFFSSPRLLCNLIPRQNQLSSPGMVEYLTLSSVLDGCTWKTVRGLKSFFPPTPLLARLEALFIPNAKLKKILRNFPTFTIWTP